MERRGVSTLTIKICLMKSNVWEEIKESFLDTVVVIRHYSACPLIVISQKEDDVERWENRRREKERYLCFHYLLA